MTRARTKRRAILAEVARESPAFASTVGLPASPGVYRFRDDRGAAIGDQDPAELRIAGHLAQMRIVEAPLLFDRALGFLG